MSSHVYSVRRTAHLQYLVRPGVILLVVRVEDTLLLQLLLQPPLQAVAVGHSQGLGEAVPLLVLGCTVLYLDEAVPGAGLIVLGPLHHHVVHLQGYLMLNVVGCD